MSKEDVQIINTHTDRRMAAVVAVEVINTHTDRWMAAVVAVEILLNTMRCSFLFSVEVLFKGQTVTMAALCR